MKRDIVWTTKFKKDYKLAIKRHMDIGLLDKACWMTLSGPCHGAKNCQRKTKTMS